MHRLLSVFVMIGLAGCATVADHYHPEALNEAAMDALVQGDMGTARILIERAMRIAPGNGSIEHNRQMIVRAQQEGLTVRPTAGVAASAQGQASAMLPLPAIWPAKDAGD